MITVFDYDLKSEKMIMFLFHFFKIALRVQFHVTRFVGKRDRYAVKPEKNEQCKRGV